MQMSLQGSNAGSVARESLRLPTPYAAPVGEVETVIADAFAEVFSVGCVGADDDFFDLEGILFLRNSEPSDRGALRTRLSAGIADGLRHPAQDCRAACAQ